MKFGIAILGLMVVISSVFADRSRPHIDCSLGFNIILSDKNTLLRGVSLSWDGGDPYGSQPKVMPTQAQLDALADDYGLNTLHLYLEGDSPASRSVNAVGYNAADCDILVQRCASAGLYLIITIGCNGENGTMDLEWSKKFWNFYGPRYKDETHVIYEAHNEPVPNTLWQWDTDDWDDQVTLYTTIRANAPDTYILLCSFMGFVGDNNIDSVYDPRNRADYLEGEGVCWNNAGLAHHGYESKVGIETAISLLQTGTNYPAQLCTEFWPGDTTGQEYNNMYESHFNGWMQFMWLGTNDDDLTDVADGFKTKIELSGTIWIPDVSTCNWPAKGASNIPAHGSSVGIFDRGTFGFIRIDGSDDLVADLASYTGSKKDLFIVEDTGDNMISLKAENGFYVSSSSQTNSLVANSATVGVTEKFIWIELSNGDVALRSFGGGGHLIRSSASGDILPNADNGRNVRSNYAFVDGAIPIGPLPTRSSPYYGSPMAVPGTIEAEDYDLGGEGVAYHDSNANNAGGDCRPSEGVDIENCSEGEYNVGWTEAGEWMNYSVHVATYGEYKITAQVARGTRGTGAFHIEVNGVDVTGSISVQDTGGWQSWIDKAANVTLINGEQVMQIVIENGDVNINHLEIVLLAPLTPPELDIHRSGVNLEISWPASGIVFNLYSTTNILPPVVWSSVANSPVDQSGKHWMVSIPISIGKARFFRLSAP